MGLIRFLKRTFYRSLNSDLILFFLKSSPAISITALPGKSRIFLGHEVCGEVIEAGQQAGDLQPGQRVVFQKNLPSCYDREIEPKCSHCRAGLGRAASMLIFMTSPLLFWFKILALPVFSPEAVKSLSRFCASFFGWKKIKLNQ